MSLNYPPMPTRLDDLTSMDDYYNISTSARLKAWELFWNHLSLEQRQSALEHYDVDIIGNVSNRKYKMIFNKQTYHIGFCDSLHATAYCVTTFNKYIPMWDKLLVQKLMLETDEERFMTIACSTSRSRLDGSGYEIICNWFRYIPPTNNPGE